MRNPNKAVTLQLSPRDAKKLVLYLFATDGHSVTPTKAIIELTRRISEAAGGGIIEKSLRASARQQPPSEWDCKNYKQVEERFQEGPRTDGWIA